jgi:hypothetical protein
VQQHGVAFYELAGTLGETDEHVHNLRLHVLLITRRPCDEPGQRFDQKRAQVKSAL